MSEATAGARVSGHRWAICALLFAAATLNSIDRQVLAVLKPVLQQDFGWGESDYANIVVAFQVSYALGFLAVGRLLDRVGIGVGLPAAVGFWTIASMAHGAATSIGQFMAARAALGFGESGGYPGSLKVVSAWFRKQEAALATGILHAGSSVGAVLTPLMVPIIALTFGWRAAFLATGALGVLWLAAWFWVNRGHAPQSAADAAGAGSAKVTWLVVLRHPGAWVFIVGKFLTDPVYSLLLNWLPDFFVKTYHLDIKTFGPPLVAVYLMADVGSVGGGWLSSRLIKRGWSLNAARKIIMLVCAMCALPLTLAIFADNLVVATLFLGLLAAAHQGWAANLFTLVPDIFPTRAVATVVGLGACAGTTGSILMSKVAGWTLEANGGNYLPLFMYASAAYLCALGMIHLLSPKLEEAKL